MQDDPIMAELYRIRAEFAKRFDNNLDAMVEHFRKAELEHPERVVSFPPKRPNRRASAKEAPETYEEP